MIKNLEAAAFNGLGKKSFKTKDRLFNRFQQLRYEIYEQICFAVPSSFGKVE